MNRLRSDPVNQPKRDWWSIIISALLGALIPVLFGFLAHLYDPYAIIGMINRVTDKEFKALGVRVTALEKRKGGEIAILQGGGPQPTGNRQFSETLNLSDPAILMITARAAGQSDARYPDRTSTPGFKISQNFYPSRRCCLSQQMKNTLNVILSMSSIAPVLPSNSCSRANIISA